MLKFTFGLFFCFIVIPLLVTGSYQANGFQGRIVTAAQVNGTWQYRSNIFKVWALGQQKLKVEFVGAYEYKSPMGPTANTGFGSGIARIEGDTAIFKPSEIGEDEECKIKMRFTKGRLIVEQEGTCGFGHNVFATGSYRKISRTKPKFGEPLP